MNSQNLLAGSVKGSVSDVSSIRADSLDSRDERIASHSVAQGRIVPLADGSSGPTAGYASRWAVESDTGLSRVHNEDSWLTSPNGRLAVLADGMGGYNAGEVASQIAVRTIGSCLNESLAKSTDVESCSKQLVQAVNFANQAIRTAASRRPECLGMGTTVVIAWQLAADQWLIGHVGDSRAYHVKADSLVRLTGDHSIGQAMLDSGAMTSQQLRAYPMRGVLTRALGVEPKVQVDIKLVNLLRGEGLMLCSDGLSDLVAESLMQQVIALNQGEPAKQVNALINLGLQAGGLDNITALLICA